MIDTNELRVIAKHSAFEGLTEEHLTQAANEIDRQAVLIAKYEAVLKEYADRENWGRNCESSWIQTVRGWELAEYVIKGDSNQ